MNRKIVFVIGAHQTSEQRIALQKFERKLNVVGVPTRNILDFADEGDETPGFHRMMQMREFIRLGTSSIVVFDERCKMCMELMLIANEYDVQFISHRDIDWDTFPKKYTRKSWIDRLDDFLRPWFSNPMKVEQAKH